MKAVALVLACLVFSGCASLPSSPVSFKPAKLRLDLYVVEVSNDTTITFKNPFNTSNILNNAAQPQTVDPTVNP